MHIAPAGTIAEAAAATTTSPVAQSGRAPWARVSSTPSPSPSTRATTPVSPTMIGIISATWYWHEDVVRTDRPRLPAAISGGQWCGVAIIPPAIAETSTLVVHHLSCASPCTVLHRGCTSWTRRNTSPTPPPT